MFYSISKQIDTRFPHCKNMQSWWICTDPGWQYLENSTGCYWYKGYADSVKLEDLIKDWTLTAPGNYTIIQCAESIKIKTPSPRSYPLVDTGTSITNLIDAKPIKRIYGDQQVTIDSDWQVQTAQTTPEVYSIDMSKSPDQTIAEVLVNTSQQFLSAYQPQLKIFLSGGLDTTLVQALLDYLNYPYQKIIGSHYDQDWFTRHNQTTLEDDTYSESGWCYRQIHHYREPTWLASGAWGDECFLRGPDVVSMLCGWHGIDILSQLTPDDYHYSYYRKHAQVFTKDPSTMRAQFNNLTTLNVYILKSWLPNDFQHWHLGNTLTWTPLKQMSIANTILNLPIEQQLAQFRSGQITQSVIKLLNPGLLASLDRYKNL